VKFNVTKSGAGPFWLWLAASLNEKTIAYLPDDFGKSRGEKKWADGEAGAGRAAKTPPVITARLMYGGYSVMDY